MPYMNLPAPNPTSGAGFRGIGRALQQFGASRREDERYREQLARQQRADELGEFAARANLLTSGFRPVAIGRAMAGTQVTPETSPMLAAPGTESVALPSEPVTAVAPRLTFPGRSGPEEVEFVDPKETERARLRGERGQLAEALGRARGLTPEQIDAVRQGASIEDVVARVTPRRTGTETIGNRIVLVDLDTGETIKDLGARPPSQATGGMGAPAVVILPSGDGYVAVDKRTLQATPVQRPGQIATGETLKPRPTETMARSQVILPRAEQALQVLEQYDKAPTESFLGRVTPGRFFIGEEAQKFNAASEGLRLAIIRPETGAAVPEPELERYALSITPQIGDKPETLRLKLYFARLTLNAIRDVAEGKASQWKPVPLPAELQAGSTAPATDWRARADTITGRR